MVGGVRETSTTDTKVTRREETTHLTHDGRHDRTTVTTEPGVKRRIRDRKTENKSVRYERVAGSSVARTPKIEQLQHGQGVTQH